MSDVVKQFDPSQKPLQISMTPNALEHVKKMIAKHSGAIGIRFGTRKSGCSGFRYDIEIISQLNADDHTVTLDPAVTVAVSSKDLAMLNGTELDFVREGLNTHFTYRNPNESGSCGCGESFSVDKLK